MHLYPSVRPRLSIDILQSGIGLLHFSADVLKGLSAESKHLNPMYLYDAAGSELFEQLCRVPEYYLTRIERDILKMCAGEIAEYSAGLSDLVEFGSGSSGKTRMLIEAFLQRQETLRYIPIDISAAAITQSAQQLVDEYPGLRVAALVAEYRRGLSRLMDENPGSKLIVFLGSNLGNFDPDQALDFLSSIRSSMSGKDKLVIGNDLAKSESILIPAYSDALGITAAFNLNILRRINRELGADFDLSSFEHLALYNPHQQRIEMHLVSTGPQDVRIGNLCMSFKFKKGERIHTESSYKYTEEQLDSLFSRAGLKTVKRWHDNRKWFRVSLLQAARAGVNS